MVLSGGFEPTVQAFAGPNPFRLNDESMEPTLRIALRLVVYETTVLLLNEVGLVDKYGYDPYPGRCKGPVLPLSLQAHYSIGSPGGIRTHKPWFLGPVHKPVLVQGYWCCDLDLHENYLCFKQATYYWSISALVPEAGVGPALLLRCRRSALPLRYTLV